MYKKTPLFLKSAEHTKNSIPMVLVASNQRATQETTVTFFPNINHSTPWLLLNKFPNIRTRTKDDWIKYVYVAIEQVCGYASIPLSIWEDLNITVNEVIGTNMWVWQKASLSMCFRKLVAAPEIEFGGPKPKKPKKVIAKYVWNSLV